MEKQHPDRVSLRERVAYKVQRMRTPLKPNLNGISWSENSSRTSLSSTSSTSTSATSLACDDDFDTMEDIYVVKQDASIQHEFTQGQLNFLKDLINHLAGALSGHEYLARLRLVGMDRVTFRPSILFITKFSKTKFLLASHFRTGPSILKRLSDIGLDIHVVLHRFGAAGSSEDLSTEHTISGSLSDRSLDLQSRLHGPYLIATHGSSGEQAALVAGGQLLLDGQPVLTSVYHALSRLDEDGGAWRAAMNTIVDFGGVEDHTGAISVYCDGMYDSDGSVIVHGTLFDSQVEAHHLNRHETDESCTVTADVSHTNFQTAVGYDQGFGSSEAETKIVKSSSATRSEYDSGSSDQISALGHSIAARLISYGKRADWTIWSTGAGQEKQVSPQVQPQRIGGFEINEIMTQDIRKRTDVTLALPEGEMSGRLQPGCVFYQVGPHQLEMKVVSLDRPLRRGCSGTWVTDRNTVCGVIVAIEDDIPEAYMLPFETIVKDIERVTKKTVSLPKPYGSTKELPSRTRLVSFASFSGTGCCKSNLVNDAASVHHRPSGIERSGVALSKPCRPIVWKCRETPRSCGPRECFVQCHYLRPTGFAKVQEDLSSDSNWDFLGTNTAKRDHHPSNSSTSYNSNPMSCWEFPLKGRRFNSWQDPEVFGEPLADTHLYSNPSWKSKSSRLLATGRTTFQQAWAHILGLTTTMEYLHLNAISFQDSCFARHQGGRLAGIQMLQYNRQGWQTSDSEMNETKLTFDAQPCQHGFSSRNDHKQKFSEVAKSDVWRMGATFCEVLLFAVQDSRVEELDCIPGANRRHAPHLAVKRFDSKLDSDYEAEIRALRSLTSRARECRLMTDLITQMMDPNPECRPSITDTRKIVVSLFEAVEKNLEKDPEYYYKRFMEKTDNHKITAASLVHQLPSKSRSVMGKTKGLGLSLRRIISPSKQGEKEKDESK